jgi:hypothetical protein
MPVATRADLEAVRGPRYIVELLEDGADLAATLAEQDAQAAARLAEALQAGDDLLSQFLPIQTLTSSDPRWNTLRRLAVDESLYFLQCNRTTPADEGAEMRAQIRRSDLAHMRKREQWPGTAEGQVSTRSQIVESSSAFASSKLIGLI